MSTFDPTQHPRGNTLTGHAGQFATKEQTNPEVCLDSLSEERAELGRRQLAAHRRAVANARLALERAETAHLSAVIRQHSPAVDSLRVVRDSAGEVKAVSVYTSDDARKFVSAHTPRGALRALGVTHPEDTAFALDSATLGPGKPGVTDVALTPGPYEAVGADNADTALTTPSQSARHRVQFPGGEEVEVTSFVGTDGAAVFNLSGPEGIGNVRITLNDGDIFNADPETGVYQDRTDWYQHALEVAGEQDA